MQLFLSIQSSNGAIASIPIGETGLRIEAEPGSIYKLVSTDGSPIRGEHITVTRTGRDLSVNGLLATEPVVILDFFLACRFDTNCRLDIATLGAETNETITPQSETLPRQADGSFLMWSSNGEHLANFVAPAPEATPAPAQSSFNGVFLGVAALGVLGLAASASSSGDSGAVANDPSPAPAPPPGSPPPSAPPPSAPPPADNEPATTISIESVINNEVGSQSVDNGASTNDASPLIVGQITEELEDGEFVQILRDGEVIDGLAFEGVEFDYEDFLAEDGQYAYQTVLTNTDGEQISTSDEFVVILDTEAPDAPQISRVEGNNIISEDEALDGIEVTGTAEAGTTILVSWGDLIIDTASDDSGNWAVLFDEAPADQGLSTMTATATDLAGNTSSEQARAVYLSSENSNDAIASLLADPYLEMTATR